MAPATGFYSTARDLCRFASAHVLGNEELLSDASKCELQAPYWGVEGSDERYGLGFSVSTVGSRTMVGHGGAFPGHSSRTIFDPTDGLVVTVLINESSAPARLLADSTVKLIDYARSGEGNEAPVGRFEGRFVNLWGATDIVQLGGRLIETSPEADNPIESPTELEVVDDDTLRNSRSGGYGAYGESVRYERDENGKALRVIIGGVSSWAEDVWRERTVTSG